MSFLKSKKSKVLVLIVLIALVAEELTFGYLRYGMYVIRTRSNPVCNSWNMGGVSADGVPNKQCLCDGKVVYKSPPITMTESGEEYCFGKIIGYEYHFHGRDFRDFDEWNNYCENIEGSVAEKKHFMDQCFEGLRRTKAAEQRLKGL